MLAHLHTAQHVAVIVFWCAVGLWVVAGGAVALRGLDMLDGEG